MRKTVAAEPKIAAVAKKISIEKGKRVFAQNCVACHQAEGQGMAGVFPPLAKSDFLMADKGRAIAGIIRGQTGEMTVNGQKYNSAMPALVLNDEQIANVLTYVLNSWGNSGDMVTVDEVKKVRAESVGQ